MPYSLIRGRRLATRCLILATGLISATCLHAQTASPVQAPAFYDEPKFTVSDVADPTSLGGHGSNATAGAKESLARDVVSLDNSSRPAPPAIVEDETALRTALQHDPANAELNYRLGKALLAAANARAAVPYLDRASRARPHDYQISFDLARAYSAAGDHAQARASILRLMAVRDNAELHRLLAGVEEESGDSLAAVHEFQRAAELEPSEPNLFDWGSELLTHRAPEPAIEVFNKGHRLFPRSVRMLTALGITWYVRGSYDQATQRLCEASDLDPQDSTPYLFLGKILGAESVPADNMLQKLARYATLQPDNPDANYFYALSLWKERRNPPDPERPARVISLLDKSVRLQPNFSQAWLQLGIVYLEQKDFSKALASLQKAADISPQSELAHYRLAQAYRQTGKAEDAQREMQAYRQAAKQNAAELARQQHEKRIFVYTLQPTNPVEDPK